MTLTLLYVLSPITTKLKLMYLKVKKKWRDYFFVASVSLLQIPISNPILNEEFILLHFMKSLFVLDVHSFLLGFISNSIKIKLN